MEQQPKKPKGGGGCGGKIVTLDVYTCSECEQTFTSQSDLFQHMPFHAEENSDELTEEEHGHKHDSNGAKQSSSDKETPEKRVTCNTSSSTSTGSEVVVKQNVKKECYITCLHCLKKLESHVTFDKHVDQSHPNVKFSCLADNCSALFSTQQGFIAHIENHKDLILFNCNYCTEFFATDKEKVKHEKGHNDLNTTKSVICVSGIKNAKQILQNTNRELAPKTVKRNLCAKCVIRQFRECQTCFLISEKIMT